MGSLLSISSFFSIFKIDCPCTIQIQNLYMIPELTPLS